jgi:hypothetical protein
LIISCFKSFFLITLFFLVPFGIALSYFFRTATLPLALETFLIILLLTLLTGLLWVLLMTGLLLLVSLFLMILWTSEEVKISVMYVISQVHSSISVSQITICYLLVDDFMSCLFLLILDLKILVLALTHDLPPLMISCFKSFFLMTLFFLVPFGVALSCFFRTATLPLALETFLITLLLTLLTGLV